MLVSLGIGDRGWIWISLSPGSFSKNSSSRERVKPWFFDDFWYYHTSLQIPQNVKKISRFSPSILTIFIDSLDFLTFPCYKEINDLSIMSVFCHFQSILKRLFNKLINLYWYYIRLVLVEMWRREGVKLTSQEKLFPKSPASLGLKFHLFLFHLKIFFRSQDI